MANRLSAGKSAWPAKESYPRRQIDLSVGLSAVRANSSRSVAASALLHPPRTRMAAAWTSGLVSLTATYEVTPGIDLIGQVAYTSFHNNDWNYAPGPIVGTTTASTSI